MCLGEGLSDDIYIPNATLSPPGWLCIQISSGMSHFNVSLIVGGRVTKMVSINHNFWTGRRARSRLKTVVRWLTSLKPYSWPNCCTGDCRPQVKSYLQECKPIFLCIQPRCKKLMKRTAYTDGLRNTLFRTRKNCWSLVCATITLNMDPLVLPKTRKMPSEKVSLTSYKWVCFSMHCV